MRLIVIIRCIPRSIVPSFLGTLGLDILPLLELDGRQHPDPGVLSFGVVDHFDLLEHVQTDLTA